MHNFDLNGTECATLLDQGVRSLLHPPFKPALPSPPKTFSIKKSAEGTGLGMFARRNIPQGAVILVEHPIIITPFLIGLPTPASELYATLAGRLDSRLRKELELLCNSRGDIKSHIEGIMQTNALSIELAIPDVPNPEISTHRALFLNVSRCNHSCGPNAVWKWDAESFSLTLQAVRPISDGQEVTIQYIDSTLPRDQRREKLRALYGFDCRCSHCTCKGSHSDLARRELQDFWKCVPSFETWSTDSRLSRDLLIRAHERAIKMRESEGLELFDYRKHVDAIAMCYGALGDLKSFRHWVNLAKQCRGDADIEHVIVLDLWLENPETFPVWGWRKS
ncbi:hypothetical protein C8J56DRAFT_790580 [Mycena floridula]|nr:hypothetical protein C8J56DRAFT_806889 [Mycena floridula]KAJ7583512.1 hypothetical protein C8J56DRAFT_790580 [Mycena floridula]